MFQFIRKRQSSFTAPMRRGGLENTTAVKINGKVTKFESVCLELGKKNHGQSTFGREI